MDRLTLHAAAAAAGLKRQWTDATGRPQQVEDAMLETLLASLDQTPADVPFLSLSAGRPLTIPGTPNGPADLTLEDGTARRVTLGTDTVTTIGYHQLTVGGRDYTIAVAPPRCPQPPGRGWGVAVQIPSLRDTQPTAYGDFGTLAKAAASFGKAGATAMAISPTHALFPGDPTRFSPYAPSSRLFHNVMLADPALIGAPFPDAAAPDLIDWQGSHVARSNHLRRSFEQAGAAVHTAVAEYAAQSPTEPARRRTQLAQHALFDALNMHFSGVSGPAWPAEYRYPDSPAVQRFAAEHAEDVAFFTFLQWLADQGLANAQKAARDHMAIGLIADLAVGTDRGGSHGWSAPQDLLTGVTIGAPPDPLGPEGQNWGISALDPFALARSGFAPFINTIRTALKHAGGIRIDHAIGLDHLWIVPDHATAADGAYLNMPGDTLKNIVAIEAHRANAIVIAEDLGTVPPGLRDDLSTRGMLGMRVLPFERDEDGKFVTPRHWDSDAVAMTGTHDTPTVVGWWKGRDIEWRATISGQPASLEERTEERNSLAQALDLSSDALEEAPLDQVLEAVTEAPAALAILPLEDLLGLEEQPNLPGTVDEHPNWRRRMPADTAALLARPDVAKRTHMLTTKRPG